MKSFRTEIENPIVEKDIIELANKIEQYNNLQIDEDKFKSVRLARGIYGQRQQGVQMIRIKLPYGKAKSTQLRRISDVSDRYSTGKLHITTRQDIQIHYVDVNDTPELWAELEKDKITIREACGNTVRNVTASETAGIDINEPFDVSPYADAVFRFFLRNPFCQEMGRKFKVSFSASDEDSGLSYMHDLGFIAKIENNIHGFKVLIAGGLGSQPRHADVLYEFLPSNKIIPMMEGVLRIFDRYGERKNRGKARLKYLINSIGLDEFINLVDAEQKAIELKTVEIDIENYPYSKPTIISTIPEVTITDEKAYEIWKNTNIIRQKQDGFVAIGVKVLLGNFTTDKARILADLVEKYAAAEIRFTLRQNLIIPFVKEELLPFFYSELKKINFVEVGYNKAVDVTACPGTDTCNLGIANSTGIAEKLEEVIKNEYPQFLNTQDLVIKISGCMNACGQHNMAHIGFQGMSVRTPEKLVAPALQVLLGGGNLGNGKGIFADKVLKIPSKRGPEALRRILNDFEKNANGNNFTAYYAAQGKKYFYDFLNDLQDVTNLTPNDFIDWGSSENYKQEIGIGECAGVTIDLVSTLFLECEEKIEKATECHENQLFPSAIYHAYSAMINGAKALLLSEDISTNSQLNTINQFDETFITTDKINLNKPFSSLIYQINENKPTAIFSEKYIQDANTFLQKIVAFRKVEVSV